jgi:hypothetical protein
MEKGAQRAAQTKALSNDYKKKRRLTGNRVQKEGGRKFTVLWAGDARTISVTKAARQDHRERRPTVPIEVSGAKRAKEKIEGYLKGNTADAKATRGRRP